MIKSTLPSYDPGNLGSWEGQIWDKPSISPFFFFFSRVFSRTRTHAIAHGSPSLLPLHQPVTPARNLCDHLKKNKKNLNLGVLVWIPFGCMTYVFKELCEDNDVPFFRLFSGEWGGGAWFLLN